MRIPLPKTLVKYGLTPELWIELYEKQGGKCAICGLEPTTGRLVVDHQHGIRNYKDLPADEKRKYIRGLLCWSCNHLVVGRGVTLKRLKRAVTYLTNYETKVTIDSDKYGNFERKVPQTEQESGNSLATDTVSASVPLPRLPRSASSRNRPPKPLPPPALPT